MLLVREHSVEMDEDSMSMYLLKLHGSMNWRLKLGCPRPFMADWLVHHESWASVEDDFDYENIPARPEARQAERHLETEPFIVPPVLSKSGLVEQPVLRLIWSLAHQVLNGATESHSSAIRSRSRTPLLVRCCVRQFIPKTSG